MVSEQDPGLRDLGTIPGQGYHVVFWTRHFNLTDPLSLQKYKWVPKNCLGNLLTEYMYFINQALRSRADILPVRSWAILVNNFWYIILFGVLFWVWIMSNYTKIKQWKTFCIQEIFILLLSFYPELGQYPVILNSHLVNNTNVVWKN